MREVTATEGRSNGSSHPSLYLPSHPCSIFSPLFLEARAILFVGFLFHFAGVRPCVTFRPGGQRLFFQSLKCSCCSAVPLGLGAPRSLQGRLFCRTHLRAGYWAGELAGGPDPQGLHPGGSLCPPAAVPSRRRRVGSCSTGPLYSTAAGACPRLAI